MESQLAFGMLLRTECRCANGDYTYSWTMTMGRVEHLHEDHCIVSLLHYYCTGNTTFIAKHYRSYRIRNRHSSVLACLKIAIRTLDLQLDVYTLDKRVLIMNCIELQSYFIQIESLASREWAGKHQARCLKPTDLAIITKATPPLRSTGVLAASRQIKG